MSVSMKSQVTFGNRRIFADLFCQSDINTHTHTHTHARTLAHTRTHENVDSQLILATPYLG